MNAVLHYLIHETLHRQKSCYCWSSCGDIWKMVPAADMAKHSSSLTTDLRCFYLTFMWTITPVWLKCSVHQVINFWIQICFHPLVFVEPHNFCFCYRHLLDLFNLFRPANYLKNVRFVRYTADQKCNIESPQQ